jgi:DnaD/phage-associated family protein
MNRDIEEKICRPLTHREIEAFLDWIETYGFTPQTVVLLVSDCIDRDKRDASYWQSMSLVFYNAGVKTYDQAQQFLLSRDRRWKEYKEILNYLGFYRLPTKPEKTYIDKWLDECKLSMEDIKAACDETVKTNRPSIKYVDGILSSAAAACSGGTKKKTGKKTKLDTTMNTIWIRLRNLCSEMIEMGDGRNV